MHFSSGLVLWSWGGTSSSFFVFIHNNFLGRLGVFIVHFVDSWTEAALLQIAKIILVYSDMFRNRTFFHGAYNNSVCVIYITHNYVVAAPTGNSGKMTCEIRRKQFTWFDNSNVNSFGPSVQYWGWIRGNWEVWGWIWGRRWRAHWPNVFLGKLGMAFCCC